MVCKDTLRIKHLPKELSDAQKQDFIRHFGAFNVRVITSKAKSKSVVYAKFENEEIAKNVMLRLHQITILNCRLSVEYAETDILQGHLTSSRVEDLRSGPDNKFLKSFINNINAFNDSVGFYQPPPAHLKYNYPKVNRATINNIAHALATVPRFYTQVLHLMNKMNLPPPFAMPEPPVRTIPAGVQMPQAPVTEISSERSSDKRKAPSSSESELESDGESSKNKEIIPEKRKVAQKKVVKRPKFVKQNVPSQPSSQHSKPAEKPDDVFEKTNILSNRKIELKVGNEPVTEKNLEIPEPAKVRPKTPEKKVEPIRPIKVAKPVEQKSAQKISEVSSPIKEKSLERSPISEKKIAERKPAHKEIAINVEKSKVVKEKPLEKPDQEISPKPVLKPEVSPIVSKPLLPEPSSATLETLKPEVEPRVSLPSVEPKLVLTKSKAETSTEGNSLPKQGISHIQEHVQANTGGISENLENKINIQSTSKIQEQKMEIIQDALQTSQDRDLDILTQTTQVDPASAELKPDAADSPEDDFPCISLEELAANQVTDLTVMSVFKNYNPGEPTNKLYIKNCAKSVAVQDLEYIYNRYREEIPGKQSEFNIRLMQEGRMKGQAFVTLDSVEQAQKAVKETNGFILKDKPLVVVFGKAGKKK